MTGRNDYCNCLKCEGLGGAAKRPRPDYLHLSLLLTLLHIQSNVKTNTMKGMMYTAQTKVNRSTQAVQLKILVLLYAMADLCFLVTSISKWALAGVSIALHLLSEQ